MIFVASENEFSLRIPPFDQHVGEFTSSFFYQGKDHINTQFLNIVSKTAESSRSIRRWDEPLVKSRKELREKVSGPEVRASRRSVAWPPHGTISRISAGERARTARARALARSTRNCIRLFRDEVGERSSSPRAPRWSDCYVVSARARSLSCK